MQAPERDRRVQPDGRDLNKLAPRRGNVVKTARERAEEKRAEKLEAVRQQVTAGSLVIRQMTDEERRRYPPRPTQLKRRVRW
jgi:hypothetical protein